MLRLHEEYGVYLTADHTATSTFFADDSTLLGGLIGHLQAQLEVVDVVKLLERLDAECKVILT